LTAEQRVAKGGRAPLFAVLRGRRQEAAPLLRTPPRLFGRETDDADARLRRYLSGIRACLVVLAVIGLVLFLRFAKDLLIPVTAGLVIAAILGPLVDQLARVVRHGSVAAAIALVFMLVAIGGGSYFVSDDVAVALEKLPELSRQLKERVSLEPPTSNPVKKIAEAAQNLEEAASSTISGGTTPQKAARAGARPPDATTVEPRPSWVRSQLLLGSTTILQGVAELAVAMLIAYFVLASGPVLRRKLFRASGYHRRQRQRFRRILYQSCKQVRLYVLILLVTNLAIALATWGVMLALGFDQAGLWGIFAGLVHIVPYVGSIALAGTATAFQYVASGNVLQSVNYGFIILVVVSLLGTLLPTWLQSKTSRMNQVAIFVGVVFWGWMWGLWGLFLGAPIVVIMKVVCDNVAALGGAARLLGD
jgi:predicted PurR-regulated permease PerM